MPPRIKELIRALELPGFVIRGGKLAIETMNIQKVVA